MPANVPIGNAGFAGEVEAAGIEPANDSDRLCVACPGVATAAMALPSGLVAWLCDRCFEKYARQAVYFIRGGDLVKIGFSRNVAKRLSAHQIGSPLPLQLWHVVEGPPSLERELHQRFAADRAHGEWFHVSDAIREYVGCAA